MRSPDAAATLLLDEPAELPPMVPEGPRCDAPMLDAVAADSPFTVCLAASVARCELLPGHHGQHECPILHVDAQGNRAWYRLYWPPRTS